MIWLLQWACKGEAGHSCFGAVYDDREENRAQATERLLHEQDLPGICPVCDAPMGTHVSPAPFDHLEDAQASLDRFMDHVRRHTEGGN